MTLRATDAETLLELARWNHLNTQVMVEVLNDLDDVHWVRRFPRLTHGSIAGTLRDMVRVGTCYQALLGVPPGDEAPADRPSAVVQRLEGINRRWVELYGGDRAIRMARRSDGPSGCLAFWSAPFGHAQRCRTEILAVLPQVLLDQTWTCALGLD